VPKENLQELEIRLKSFAIARDWVKFHTPKNLVMALSVEVAELVEIFQWMTPEESSEAMNDPRLSVAIKDELADVMLYLVCLSSMLRVDLVAEAHTKIDVNEGRFPIRSNKSAH